MLQSVGVLYHPHRPQAITEAEWFVDALRHHTPHVFLGNGWDPRVVMDICCDRELLVVFGGDGTIIHVARLAAQFEIPVLGINLGRVGFLAEMTPTTLRSSVEAIAEGRFWIEQRTMLDAVWDSEGEKQKFLCLNEVAVARGGSAHAVHVSTTLDGNDLMTYTADGVLVATATGSTAYSLAAGGPILYPESQDFVITPVAPHLHIGRSIIVPGTTTVHLRLASDRSAFMTVDGVDERPLGPRDVVHVERSQQRARFARLGLRTYFYSAIAARLK